MRETTEGAANAVLHILEEIDADPSVVARMSDADLVCALAATGIDPQRIADEIEKVAAWIDAQEPK